MSGTPSSRSWTKPSSPPEFSTSTTSSSTVGLATTRLRQGLIEPTGIVTEKVPFTELPLRPFDEMVLAGHEISSGDLTQSAGELVRHGVLPASLVAASSADAAAMEADQTEA